jgi:hypothetical protein
MSEAAYALMPEMAEVRELLYHIIAKGSRTRVVTVVTTLTDSMHFPKREIARLRWSVPLLDSYHSPKN